MPKITPKTILLYNHATGTGHHESWTALFAALLLERGYRVICITPDTSALKAVLETQGVLANDNLHLMVMPAISLPPPTFLQRIKAKGARIIRSLRGKSGDSIDVESLVAGPKEWRPTLRDRWQLNAHRYAKNAPEVQVTADLPVTVRLKRHILHLFVPPVWHTLRILHRPTVHAGSRYPANLANAAYAALKQAPWKPDFMLSMYADIWMTHPSCWNKAVIDIPVPWGGIRFAPFPKEVAGKEGYFRDPKFRGFCFLDEEATDYYQRRMPTRVFEFLPDVANATLPSRDSALAEEMRRLADGRKIVLMCGSIEGRKNVRMFCEVAQLPSTEQFFFAIVGQMHASTFSTEEKRLLNPFIAAQTDNTFFRDVYFEDEREMNAIIRSADIIFAVYRDFRISSNMLGKAASFQKPILVSDRYLMGRRVLRYDIGLAVSEDEPSKTFEGLSRVARKPIPAKNFSQFCMDFSQDALAERLDNFLGKCLHGDIQ